MTNTNCVVKTNDAVQIYCLYHRRVQGNMPEYAPAPSAMSGTHFKFIRFWINKTAKFSHSVCHTQLIITFTYIT